MSEIICDICDWLAWLSCLTGDKGSLRSVYTSFFTYHYERRLFSAWCLKSPADDFPPEFS